MKKITLLLLAVFALSFSAIAQVKMYLHFSDGTTYETLASLVDSITFDLPSVDPSDPSFPSIPEEDEEINEGENNDGNEENNGNDNNPDLSEIDLPEIDLPGEGRVTICVHVEQDICGYIVAPSNMSDWISGNEDMGTSNKIMTLVDGTTDWYQITYDMLEDEYDPDRFKIVKTDANGNWEWSYQLDEGDILRGDCDWLLGYDIYVNSDDQVVYINVESFKDDPCESSSNELDGYEYVDLGLPSGTLWATMNVGADYPEDYGYYFAWGEVFSKEYYDWYTYKYSEGSSTSLTKYVTESTAFWGTLFGEVDNIIELEDDDDAAYVKWGTNWRMPTESELIELYDECTWIYNEELGGYWVIGPNNNSIFLPAAGYIYEDVIEGQGERGSYWTKSLDNDYAPDRAWALYFDDSINIIENTYRNTGRTIRPVVR